MYRVSYEKKDNSVVYVGTYNSLREAQSVSANLTIIGKNGVRIEMV